MPLHTTNYFNTFIEVAADTKAVAGNKPPSKGDKKTIAEIQYELIADKPYQLTSDDVLFRVFAERNDLTGAELHNARAEFFAKAQACFRASPLTKTYGFGVHCDDEGKMALFGLETPAYEEFLNDDNIKKVKAMRSKR